MAAVKPIPTSSATTGWELLLDVKRALREEYKRANMHHWKMFCPVSNGGPACETVGCMAGWIGLLGAPQARYSDDHQAKWLLGSMDYNTVGCGEYVFNQGEGDACEQTKPGTRAHARAVIQRITHFMRVNEVALKARELPVIRERPMGAY